MTLALGTMIHGSLVTAVGSERKVVWMRYLLKRIGMDAEFHTIWIEY